MKRLTRTLISFVLIVGMLSMAACSGTPGTPGEPGNGITSIIKINSSGLVDTYKIAYTNGSASIFTVTNGEQGIQGIQGEKGEDGHTPVITIQDGYWYVDGVNTNQYATGLKGATGNGISSIAKVSAEGLIDTYKIIYTNGKSSSFTVTNGAQGIQGIQGIQGEKGEDGHTPVITIQNGNWYIDGVDSGKSAEGIKGDTGNGISEIKLTSTEDLVDTYTITYTDGKTSTFTVTNGAQGIQGIQGVPGADGHTPVITIQNGYWYIDGVNTNQSAEGIKGDDGLSAFEIYQKYHPEYTGTEEEWIESLKGSDGNNGEQGVSVVNAYINSEMHLILVLSNSTEIDAGYIGVPVTPSPVTYTVTFVDYNGTELKVETVESGKSATAPVDPTREGYTFVGWDKEFNNVTSDLTVTAQYQEITSPTVIIHNAVANIGDDTVTVLVSLLNNPGISSMKLSIAYGNELILQDIAFNSTYGAYVTAPSPYNNPQSITFISPLQEVNVSDTFATLTFALSDTVTESTFINISVTVDQENTYDENFVEVTFATVNGKVTINEN